MKDNINPSHYRRGKVECIDALESATLNKSGIEAVCTANAIKYLWRYEEKGGVEDVKKAKWYIERLINTLEKEVDETRVLNIHGHPRLWPLTPTPSEVYIHPVDLGGGCCEGKPLDLNASCGTSKKNKDCTCDVLILPFSDSAVDCEVHGRVLRGDYLTTLETYKNEKETNHILDVHQMD